MDTTDLLKGTLKTIILKLLSDNNRMYGYEITQKVKILTEGKLQLTEGALYPSLHKLESEGLLTHEKEIVNNRVRKYYKLTLKGRKKNIEKQKSFIDFISLMELIFNTKTQH